MVAGLGASARFTTGTQAHSLRRRDTWSVFGLFWRSVTRVVLDPDFSALRSIPGSYVNSGKDHRALSVWLRPTGVSSDTGSREMIFNFCTLSTGMSMRRPIRQRWGPRPRCSSSGRKRNTILAASTLRGSQHMTITKSAVLMAATAALSTSALAQLAPSRVLTLDAAARDGESHG